MEGNVKPMTLLHLNIAGECVPVLFDGTRVTCPDFPTEPMHYQAPCGTTISQEMLVAVCKTKNQTNKTTMYYAIPIVPGEFTFPLHPEPLPLDRALDQIRSKMQLIETQGFWRNCRGERVPVSEVGFAIKPADDIEEQEDDEEGEE
jgi:hypothetical protein